MNTFQMAETVQMKKSKTDCYTCVSLNFTIFAKKSLSLANSAIDLVINFRKTGKITV